MDEKNIETYSILYINFPDIVAEVTQPSLGVGYEIGRAVDMKKPILCLYRPQEGKCKHDTWSKFVFELWELFSQVFTYLGNFGESILPI